MAGKQLSCCRKTDDSHLCAGSRITEKYFSLSLQRGQLLKIPLPQYLLLATMFLLDLPLVCCFTVLPNSSLVFAQLAEASGAAYGCLRCLNTSSIAFTVGLKGIYSSVINFNGQASGDMENTEQGSALFQNTSQG